MGAENLVSTCYIIELGGSILEKGRSKDSYLGGFALKQYSVLHGQGHTYPNGILIGYNFGILQLGDLGGSFPALWVTGICPTVPTRQSLLLINYAPTSSMPLVWEGYLSENETMTGVRCKKK